MRVRVGVRRRADLPLLGYRIQRPPLPRGRARRRWREHVRRPHARRRGRRGAKPRRDERLRIQPLLGGGRGDEYRALPSSSSYPTTSPAPIPPVSNASSPFLRALRNFPTLRSTRLTPFSIGASVLDVPVQRVFALGEAPPSLLGARLFLPLLLAADRGRRRRRRRRREQKEGCAHGRRYGGWRCARRAAM
ncbi:hypothetical protein DFH06DRAFT_452921 [Mycena polygramma]|nr:hypothetical protein DFH06DRAFT_452921 [Mycena polygramma]